MWTASSSNGCGVSLPDIFARLPNRDHVWRSTIPIPVRLTHTQAMTVADQCSLFSHVRQEAVLGSSLLVRVLFEGRETVVKLFREQSIFSNEIRALARLAGCAAIPRLHRHGVCAEGLRLDLADQPAHYRFWLCRDWVQEGDTHRLPIARPAAFVASLDDLVAACNRNGVVMADAKRANFVWDGTQLCWLDFGWFTVAPPDIAERRNHEFRDRLLRKLGW